MSLTIKIVAFLGLFTILSAHPHMFVDVSQHYTKNDQGISGFKMTWKVDKMNSLQILEAYDDNGNGKIDGSESKTMAKTLIPLIQRVVQLKLDAKKLGPAKVEAFATQFSKNIITYSFFIPIKSSGGEVSTSVIDADNFVNFEFIPNQITCDASSFPQGKPTRSKPWLSLFNLPS